tara:strand:- start:158035 stop:159669 length:1635 start_codon:yes stop_codon:yes gene_type:complete
MIESLFDITSFNIDLLIVGVSTSAIGLLGFLVYFNNPRSITNKTFLVFAIMTILWSFTNLFQYKFGTIEHTLLALRTNLFIAVLHAFAFFQLGFVFPSEKKKLPKWHLFLVIPATLLTAILTLTPFVFTGIEKLAPIGEITNPERGPGVIVFSLVSFTLLFLGLFYLFRKILRTEKLEKKQAIFTFSGMFFTALLIVAFSVFLPIVFSNLSFLPFSALFMLPFIALVSYTIYKHQLFNLKVMATGFLIFLIATLTFVEIIFTKDLILIFFRGGVLLLILVAGVLLIRSVMREVWQREQIEILAKDLRQANSRLQKLDRQKSEFVSIASHQLRSPITAIRGYISLILENEFGKYPETLKEPLNRIAESSRLMIKSIEDYLNISRIEQGRMKYEMSEFDLADLTKTVVNEYGPVAEKKALGLTFTGAGKILVNADVGKIKQVIANLVDNSIKYTPSGNVTVKATMFEGKARVTVSDTGVGLAKEDIGDLFNKFIRARGANKINTSGTGLGLYVAKQMIEAHKGKIWAESEGKGKGSRFIFELPSTS